MSSAHAGNDLHSGPMGYWPLKPVTLQRKGAKWRREST